METTPAAPVSTPAAQTPPAATVPTEETPRGNSDADRAARALKVLQAGREQPAAGEQLAIPGTEAPKPDAATATPPAADTKPSEEAEESAAPSRHAKKILEINEKEKTLGTKEADLSKREADIAARESTFKTYKDNPLKLLEAAGLTFSELADAVIADSKIPENIKAALRKQEEDFRALRDEQAEKDKAAAEAKRLADDEFVDNSIKDFRRRLNLFIESKADEYELINLAGAQDLVYDIIDDYWQKHETLLDPEKACEAAEKFLYERAEKMSKSKKLAPKTLPPPEVKKQPSTVTTLTNAMTNGKPATADKKGSLSKDERLARAVSKLKYQ